MTQTSGRQPAQERPAPSPFVARLIERVEAHPRPAAELVAEMRAFLNQDNATIAAGLRVKPAEIKFLRGTFAELTARMTGEGV